MGRSTARRSFVSETPVSFKPRAWAASRRSFIECPFGCGAGSSCSSLWRLVGKPSNRKSERREMNPQSCAVPLAGMGSSARTIAQRTTGKEVRQTSALMGRILEGIARGIMRTSISKPPRRRAGLYRVPRSRVARRETNSTSHARERTLQVASLVDRPGRVSRRCVC